MVTTLPQDTQQFLELLFDANQYVTIALKGPGDNKTAEWRGPITDFQSEILSKHVPRILQDETNQVLIGPLPRSYRVKGTTSPGTQDDIREGLVAWVDLDFKDQLNKTEEQILHTLQSLTFPPSLLIHSGNGFHCYWLLEGWRYADKVEAANNGLKEELERQQFVIDNHTNPAHLMRLPGSWNLKEIDPTNYTLEEIRAKRKLCRIVDWYPERKYALEELPQYTAPEPKRPTRKAHAPASPLPSSTTEPTASVFNNISLLGLLDRLPSYIRRMLACGEVFDPETGRASKIEQDGE